MKNRNHILRIVITVFIGLLIIYKTYQFKYSDFVFDGIIYSVIAIIGLIIWVIILYKDWILFRKSKQANYLINGIIGGIFLITVFGINRIINKNFDKPTLLKVFYDGDYNGTGIDFKTDGTYIFDNFCLGSNYEYGTYEINGNKITLDKYEIDNVIKTNQLEIRPKIIEYVDQTKTENYIYQVNEQGEILRNKIEFRIVIDNRIIKSKNE